MSFDFLFGLMFLAKYSRPFTSLPPTKVFSSHLDIELAIMFTQDQKASSRICISATMAYSSSSVTWVAVTMPPVRKSRMYVSRLKSYHLLNSCSHLFWPFLFVSVSYTHLRAHETRHDLVCRLLLEKKKIINTG